MTEYVQSYIDVLTGVVPADNYTKQQFRQQLQEEVNKIAPLFLECKNKGIDMNELCPEVLNDFIEMGYALCYGRL